MLSLLIWPKGFRRAEGLPLEEMRPEDTIPSAILRGSRVKEELTQAQLSEMTCIPRQHISEMEHGKRPIGKETGRRLAKALKCDYRVFL